MLEFKILITFRPMSWCLSDVLCGRGRAPQAWRHLVRLWQYSCSLSWNLQCWILASPVLLECVMRKLFQNQRQRFLATAEENWKTWVECLVRRDQCVFGSFGLESYHVCGLEPGVARLFWGATCSRPAGGEWDSCSPSSWQERLNAGSWPVFPHNCCGITGAVEPYFLDTCLTKPLLESFTVMLCPKATKDVFNLKFSVIGAVGLVAVMIFGRIFSV